MKNSNGVTQLATSRNTQFRDGFIFLYLNGANGWMWYNFGRETQYCETIVGANDSGYNAREAYDMGKLLIPGPNCGSWAGLAVDLYDRVIDNA